MEDIQWAETCLWIGRNYAIYFIWTGLATAVVGLVLRSLKPDAEAAIDYKVPLPPQCLPGWKGEVLEKPSLKKSGSNEVQCYCPASGQLLGYVNPSTPDGIDRARTRAAEAQIKWAKTTFAERRQVLRTMLKWILSHQDDIATVACMDSGKTRVDACFGEILVTAEKLKWTIDHGEKALRPDSRPTNLLMMYKKNEVRYEPLGVVAACVSWNYPFHNLMGPIISALFSGNAILVKNSEQTAWSSKYFIAIARGALSACNHSPDLVHAITCWPTTASHLTSHPLISHLTFIGSRPVAHAVCTSAAKSLTPVVVELGGKDAAIILDGSSKPLPATELSRIESIILRGVFQSAGQNCIGIERVIAMPKAYSHLVKTLAPRIRALRLGNALTSQDVDVGAMISDTSFSRLESLVSDAVAQGATLVCGGTRHRHPDFPSGHYFQPTLLIDVTSEMRIAQDECFAPICCLMRADSVDSAIRIANSTPFGLGCSVFGPDDTAAARAALDTVARESLTGMVAINDFAAYYAVQLPFGGVRGSGYGRFAGEEGLRGLCNAKSVCVDRWPRLIKTAIPAKLDYPMQGVTAWEMGKGVVELGYGETVGRKITGLRRMVGI